MWLTANDAPSKSPFLPLRGVTGHFSTFSWASGAVVMADRDVGVNVFGFMMLAPVLTPANKD